MPGETVVFDYEISFTSGRVQNFHIELDFETLSALPPPREIYPEWTKLSSFQCPLCPLDPQKHPHCPVAVSLLSVTDVFAHDISYEKVNVTVRTKPRNYSRKTTLQDALRSLFGIYMVTSGCPILDKLRPMVATHLPFATITETAYRAFSMYALAQHFIQKNGGTPDWEFKNLGKFYEDVEKVNVAFQKRLVNAGFEDASLNAVSNLSCQAQFTQMLLEPKDLVRIEHLFAPYLKDPKNPS